MNGTLKWTSYDLLEATGGELLCGEKSRSFTGISIDSRSISSGDLYVPIIGDVHDGHKFIKDVIGQGTDGLIVSKGKVEEPQIREWQEQKVVCIAVDNTTRSLGDLARYHRKRSGIPLVAITGSNGKTTTREMMAAVLSQRFTTLSTKKNFNNDIGLPLTLFELNSGHECAVVEIGMNHPGEIERLAEICGPDIGVITNIGPAHLEGVGSMDGVMNAKGELLGKIKPYGTAVLNSDDQRILQLADQTSAKVFFFGFSENADVRALNMKPAESGTSFTLALPTGDITVNLNAPGVFMVSNALAAAAAGFILGLNGEEIKAGLERFKPVSGRMNILTTRNGIHVIDDTYNANPDSMKAALNTLEALRKDSRSFFIVGDMFELGKHAESLHREIGTYCAKSKVSILYATGQYAEIIASGARKEGMDHNHIFTGNKEEILNHTKNYLKPNDWVLIKGSRAVGMEKMVEELMAWANN